MPGDNPQHIACRWAAKICDPDEFVRFIWFCWTFVIELEQACWKLTYRWVKQNIDMNNAALHDTLQTFSKRPYEAQKKN